MDNLGIEGSVRKGKQAWQKIVQVWLDSNFSISSFCRKHNLTNTTFHYWRKKLAPNSKRKTLYGAEMKQKFVPVELLDNKKTHEDGLLLHYPNGCSIRLKRDFDLTILRLIHEALGVRSC